MDDGEPIAYQLLEDGVAVRTSDGVQLGKVGAVLSVPKEDVFHGLLIDTPDAGVRFVEAAAIASMHERGVELRIDSVAAKDLPEPEHHAASFGANPGRQQGWRHWMNLLSGRNDWDHRD
ncbi:MAG TPA: hypothetical protein VH025_02405 [Solirubrobacteraceae bacterium]|nr:hypothetical protein [Solirubrobacteraceae bacterium]